MLVNGSCGWRRRELLVAGLASVLATSACSVVPGQSGTLDSSEVLRPVLSTARRLAAAHEALAASASSARESLEMMRDNHSEHVQVLEKLLGVSSEGSEPGDIDSLESLRDAESAATDQAAKACAGAPDDYAVLLGEIAACRATHHDVLKVL